jgi:adenylate cyclase
MGDGALIRIPDPVEAVRLAVCITREIGPERGFPLVRVGLDHGPAVSRRGDWFGATINTASRIVSLADAGEVLITSRARTAAGETGHGIDFEDSGLRQLRHITDPVRLYRASPHRAA